MKSTRSRIKSSIHFKSQRHYLLLTAIVLMAALLRFWNLSGLPSGVHGDEGIVGYEARRILQEGSIGPFSPASFGQPSGPIYFAALSELLFGETIFAIRLISALAGTLTVVALYVLIRPHLGKNIALIGSFVLATLCWHIHYARIAFPLECWPLICVLIASATLQAIKVPTWKWWALAGFINGLGVYAYKAHPLFFAITAGFAAVHLFRTKISWRTKAGLTGIYIVFAVLAANFLLRYALVPEHNYNGHLKLFSVFNQPQYQALDSTFSRFLFLSDRYVEWWKSAVFFPQIDGGDAAGIVPLISYAFFILFVIGLLVPKKNFNERQWPLILFSRAVVVLMPISSVVTIEAFARRTFALAPFLCVLAAVGAAEIIRFGNDRRIYGRIFAPAVVMLLLTFGAIQSWRDYYLNFAKSQMQGWVFCQELTQSLAYIKTLPPESPIYFYSGRWSITYDTRKFLAPNLNAMDCSREFSTNRSLVFLQSRPEVKTTWVFMAPYLEEIEFVKSQFPGGKEVTGPDNLQGNDPAYRAYELN